MKIHLPSCHDGVESKVSDRESEGCRIESCSRGSFQSDICHIFKSRNFYNIDAIITRIGLNERAFDKLATSQRKGGFANGKLASE